MTGEDKTVYINPDSLGWMTSNQTLKDSDYTVFVLLMGLMDESNMVRMTQAQLAERMGRSRKYISASLGRLRSAGCLRTTRFGIMVNPEIAWKGTVTDREDLIIQELERALDGWRSAKGHEIAL